MELGVGADLTQAGRQAGRDGMLGRPRERNMKKKYSKGTVRIREGRRRKRHGKENSQKGRSPE